MNMEKATLKQLSSQELEILLSEKRKDLQQMRFKNSQGKFPEMRKIREIKTMIARILTILNIKT